MSEVHIEPHYLGNLEYYSLISNYDSLKLEVQDRFQKQTFRNRSYILGANKVLPLIVPVSYNHDTISKDVRVDYQQRWIKDHWGAFYSSYGKAPFFEYFADFLSEIWDKKHKFLVDLSVDFLHMTFKILTLDVKMAFTDRYQPNVQNDFRNLISPKKSFTYRKIYRPKAYVQLFGDNFNPNLSIIDLIMNEGPKAQTVISASFLKE